MLRSTLATLAICSLLPPSALAGTEQVRLSWTLSVDGKPAGTRRATVTFERVGAQVARTIEAFTDLSATLATGTLTYQQRLTAFADTGPAAFQAVVRENGQPREVSGRWSVGGWTVTIVDKKDSRTYQTPPARIELSTADLLDPNTRVPLRGRTTAKILSAETGDVWEGTVEELGTETVAVRGDDVIVQGFAWVAPVGRTEVWYDADGWLVRFRTAVLGHAVEGVLVDPPPKSGDAFTVEPLGGGVLTDDL